MKKILSIVLTMVLLVGANLAAAADAVIELATIAEVEVEVVNDQGEKEIQRMEAAKVVPGDEVIYTIRYVNVGTDPAGDVAITNPVPEHMAFNQLNAPSNAVEITISVDGGQNYDAPENLTVRDTDGNERPAVSSDYTHIRWVLQEPVQPGDEGNVGFRAQLL